MWFLHTKNHLTRSLSQSLTKAFGVCAYIRHTKPEKKKKKRTKRKTNELVTTLRGKNDRDKKNETNGEWTRTQETKK